MIFYFTGTGNCRSVAERIAQEIDDRAINIIDSNINYNFSKETYVGFVFPVYAYAAPQAVLDFARKLPDAQTAFTFAVCTYSNVAGEAIKHFSEHFPVDNGYGIRMPDNFPVLEKILETEETAHSKMTLAREKLKLLITLLKARQSFYDIDIGENAYERTYQVADTFNKMHRSTKGFYAERELCNGCGLCEKICPAKAISISTLGPTWVKDTCYLCMACLNRCPKLAIEMGKFSKGRFRYYLKNIDAEDYIKPINP